MNDYADLEISLHRRGANSYAVELRFSHPDNQTDVRLTRDDAALVEFDDDSLNELMAATNNPEEYGKLLTHKLFADRALSDAFSRAKDLAEEMLADIRIRLYVSPSATELHSLHWETLCDPHDMTLLSTRESIIFSRYLSSFDWQSIRLRPMATLKALVVVANPAGLDKYEGMAPVQVDDELTRVRQGLADMPLTELTTPCSATLINILHHLREEDRKESGVFAEQGGFDILYIVCHGSFRNNESWLWLEDAEGNIDRVSGEQFIAGLRGLSRRPRLVVLVSCQSAGSGHDVRTNDDGALAALGPRLAELGIPAVIAMQGNVTMATIDDFMPVFFDELSNDGQVDRALAVARSTVQDRPDWWMPVLYMRLREGRIWYVPGFGDDKGTKGLPLLIKSINREKCMPIIGPGVVETLLDSQRNIARAWAASHNFPMEPHNRDDLPQVAQYLTVSQGGTIATEWELEDYLTQALINRFRRTALQDWSDDEVQGKSLDELIRKVGHYIWDQNPEDPLLTLAQWPVKIYINTLPGNLLVEALRRVDKKPRIEICRWKDSLASDKGIAELDPDYEPSVEEPLVYHLFGRFDEDDSLVITEDDYFDFLIGSTSNKDMIPPTVRESFVNSALLFLGFYIEDWNFRVLFRSIVNAPGISLAKRYAHVAAQIAPSEGRLLDPRRAQSYLLEAFSANQVNIYWGSINEFTAEIQSKLPPPRGR